jgi:hypothetical protein
MFATTVIDVTSWHPALQSSNDEGTSASTAGDALRLVAPPGEGLRDTIANVKQQGAGALAVSTTAMRDHSKNLLPLAKYKKVLFVDGNGF